MGKTNRKTLYSQAGRKGAEVFWRKFRSDNEFQQKMRDSWRGHKVNKERIIEAARLGGKALWQRIYKEPNFKKMIDTKLAKSRARGGSISLRKLGEDGFKRRLENMKN